MREPDGTRPAELLDDLSIESLVTSRPAFASRISFLAVSCGGFLPLTIAVMMSGASVGRRKRR
jgi:hypothetical protein